MYRFKCTRTQREREIWRDFIPWKKRNKALTGQLAINSYSRGSYPRNKEANQFVAITWMKCITKSTFTNNSEFVSQYIYIEKPEVIMTGNLVVVTGKPAVMIGIFYAGLRILCLFINENSGMNNQF